MSKKSAKSKAAAFANDRRNLPADARVQIANAVNDITIPYYSGVMQHADDTLIQRGGGKGLAIYDEIERDTHAYAMLQKRKKTLLAREWEVEPGGDRPIDQEAADLVRRQLEGIAFDRICEDLLDATLKGYAISEVIWARDGAEIKPAKVVSHDQRRFAFDHDWQPRLLTYGAMRDGIELPGRKFIVHRYGVKGNNPYGLGIGTRLFWPVLFKREGITFWLHFLEKFAGPTVIGKTPYGMMSDEQTRLLNNLANTRTSSAILVPIGTDVDFLEASRSGSVTYENFLSYWDKQIAICTTGETLTSDVGSSGSRALGEVHEEMLGLLVDSDADLLSGTLHEQLVQWIIDYNLPGAALPNIWRVRQANEKALAETRSAKAAAAEATNKAIIAVVRSAGAFEDDEIAREYIVSFEITDQLTDGTIDQLVAARHAFAAQEADPFAVEPVARGPAFAGGLKKKL